MMCAKHGVDYVDLCGEPGWMFEMQKHLATAKESGARIVHSCGFDSIPSDLGVMLLQKLQKKGLENQSSKLNAELDP